MRFLAAALLFLVPDGLSDAEFAKLLPELGVKTRPWASVAWEDSLYEARVRAAREGKPLFVNVNTGNALGFV